LIEPQFHCRALDQNDYEKYEFLTRPRPKQRFPHDTVEFLSLPEIKKITAKIFSTHTSSNKATPETMFCQPFGGHGRSKIRFSLFPPTQGVVFPPELRLRAVPTTAT
jgi:hypothetical protein